MAPVTWLTSSPDTDSDLAEPGLFRLDCRLSDNSEVRGAASGGVLARGAGGGDTAALGSGSVELSSVVTDFRLIFSKLRTFAVTLVERSEGDMSVSGDTRGACTGWGAAGGEEIGGISGSSWLMLMMVAPFLSRDRDRDLRRTSSASRVSTASPHVPSERAAERHGPHQHAVDPALLDVHLELY